MKRCYCMKVLQLSAALLLISQALIACDDEPAPRSDLSPVAGEDGPTGSMMVSSSGLAVTSPMRGAISGVKEVTVTGTHPTALMVTVNEDSVPVMGGSFSHVLTLAEGPHVIEVSDSSSLISIEVMVDLTAPHVEIGTPAYGSHIDSAQNQSVTVTGSAVDALSGVSEATINGVSVPVDPNGAFQFTYQPEEGLSLISVTVADQAGHESTAYRSLLYGRFKEWSTPVGQALGAFVSPYGLDAIERAIESALDSGLINELVIDSLDPSSGVRVEGIEVMETVISLEPRDGFIEVAIALQGLRVDFSLDSPETTGDIYVDAILSAKLYLDAVAGGSLDVRIEEPSVSLDNFDIYIRNGALGALSDFLEGFIGDFAEDALLTVLEELLVEGLLDPSLFRPTLTVLNTPLELQVLVESAEVTAMGVELLAGLGLSSPAVVRQAPGYLFDVTPAEPMRSPSMVSAFAILNSLQMVLGQIWRAGIMDINLLDLIDEPPSALSAAVLNGFTAGQLTEYMAPTEAIGVKLRPSLPPVGRFDAQAPQAVFIDLNDLLIDLTLPSGEAWLTLGLNLTARVEPGILNNDLQLSTTLSVEVWPVAEPLFPVDSARIIGLFVPLIENLPNLVGVQVGAEPLISITELDLFGVQLSTTELRTQPSPGGVAILGLQISSP